VRFYDREERIPRKATVYDGETITQYERGGSGPFREIETTPHPYGRVPINVYKANGSGLPFFESEKGLIDAQDKLLSSSVNEVDRFNAVMALFPFKVDKAFVDKLRDMNVIDDLDQFERWPEYLEKDLGKITAFYDQLADRLERLFHKSIKVPDFSDENFVGNASGVALAYKLLGLEFKAAQIDIYFDRGIRGRYELIGRGLNAGVARYNLDDYEAIIDNKRNLPVDDAAKVQIAQQLMGIVSQETILKMLPNSIVPDVEKELERLKGEPDMTLDLPEGEGMDMQIGATEKVQDSALNGAQVQGMQAIVQSVAGGTLPAESAIMLLTSSFPTINEERARAIIMPAAGFVVRRDDTT